MRSLTHSEPRADRQTGAGRPQNPFPGPQAYGRDDERYFFGRSDEVEEVTSLVLSSSAVLLYGPSGAGKSSLLQAGLAPYLENRFSFAILPPVRPGSGPRATLDATARNPFLSSVCDGLRNPSDEDKPATLDIAALAQRHRRGKQRVLLIVDQFEEVFADPSLGVERREFFKELSATLDANQWLRAVIALRSDYLANLVPYERYLPENLAVRYQVEQLIEPQAREAIQESFTRSEVDIAPADVDTVLTLLLTSRSTSGEDPPVRAEYVNTIQLQILCRRLWQELAPTGYAEPVLTPDSGFDLQQTMVEFVNEAIDEAVARTRCDEGTIRRWLRDNVITSSGRRSFVLVEEERTAGLPNSVLEALIEVKLLQVEQRNDARLVELTHDSMTEGVQASNDKWLHKRQRDRRRRSMLWLALLSLLLSLFPFLQEPADQASLAARSGTIAADRPARVPFTGPDGVVVVEWEVYGDDSDVSMQVTDDKKNAVVSADNASADQAVGEQLAPGDGRVAFIPRPGSAYSAVLSTKSKGSSEYTVNVLSVPRMLVGKKAAEDVHSRRFGIPVPQGAPTLLRLRGGFFLGVSAADVLYRNSGRDIVIVQASASNRASAAVLDLSNIDPRRQTRIMRRELRPVASVSVDGPPQRIVFSDGGLVAVTQKRAGGSALVSASCSKPPTVAMLDEADVSQDYDDQSYDLPEGLLPVHLDRGTHQLFLGANGTDSSLTCVLSVRSSAQKAITDFGPHTLHMPRGSNAEAYELRLPTSAVVIAEPQSGPSPTLICSGEPTGADGHSERLLEFIPKGVQCSLWLSRFRSGDPASFSLLVASAATPGRK